MTPFPSLLLAKLAGNVCLYTIATVVVGIQTPPLQLIMTDQGMLEKLFSLFNVSFSALFCRYDAF